MDTFVVRVFVPAEDEGLELTGIVEHVTTGTVTPFRGPGDLIGVVLHELGRDTPNAAAATEDPAQR